MDTGNSDWNTGTYGHAALEDRCAPRQRLNIAARLRPSGGRAFQTIVSDLSLGGFCANSMEPMIVGNRCWLSLNGMEALKADVIWWESGRVGCAFHTLLSPISHDNIVLRYRGDSVFRRI